MGAKSVTVVGIHIFYSFAVLIPRIFNSDSGTQIFLYCKVRSEREEKIKQAQEEIEDGAIKYGIASFSNGK